jgi:hypothetical protein
MSKNVDEFVLSNQMSKNVNKYIEKIPTHMYLYMYVCVCIYIYIHTHTHTYIPKNKQKYAQKLRKDT